MTDRPVPCAPPPPEREEPPPPPRSPPSPSPRHRLAWLGLPAVALIRAYQVTLGPLMGGHCRFQPTCSEYARQAYTMRDPLTATLLTLRRLARCHPLGGSGHDPVPPRSPDR